MKAPKRGRLGDELVEAGNAARPAVEAAAAEAAKRHAKLGDILIEQGAAAEVDVYRALAAQKGLPFSTADQLMAKLDPKLGALRERLTTRVTTVDKPVGGLTPQAIEHQSSETVRQVAVIIRGEAPVGAVNEADWMRRPNMGTTG